MAAEIERDLLNHYRLTNLYPSEWPQREDESEPSEDELEEQTKALQSRPSHRKSRYSGLDRRTKFKSRLSESKAEGGGSGNIVQKDEADPLGIAPSVVSELRRRGLSVEDDLKLRNRFLLSSTTFSPTLFLSQVHQSASTDDLLRGLDFLSKSIEKKSASLKVLVESNFERFVRAKATIDNVYTEMRTQGQGPLPVPATPSRPHSRHNSRGGGHFRKASNPFSAPTAKSGEEPRKNSLTKETEYGVQGIKAPLIEVASKAEEVWGPALGGRAKEHELKGILDFVEHNRSIMQLAGNIQTSIRKRDYDNLVKDYQKARRASQEAKDIADAASTSGAILTDTDIRQIIITAKMWYGVENQIEEFRTEAVKQLSSLDTTVDGLSNSDRRDTHTNLISVLLQLGTDDNPIWIWLSSWQERLKLKISLTSERSRFDVEILRRRLANGEGPSLLSTKSYLESPSTGLNSAGRSDSAKIIQFWETVEGSLKSLLDQNGGLLGEIADYWESARSFIDGKAQKNLGNPTWASGESKQHLYLTPQHMAQLQDGAAELIHFLREIVFMFFTEPPIDDLSELISPVPQTPSTPGMTLSIANTPRKFKFDPSDIPPPSPKRGDSWERFAFWPPYATSLSGVQYLSRVLILVGTAASDAAAMSVVRDNPRVMESLRSLVGSVRERCIQAVCAAWNNDAEKCKVLEDWTRSIERRDLTNMPSRFNAYEETILIHMQKILYLSEAMTRADSSEVVLPPSAKLLQTVRSQFVTSLYKALSGAVENAERFKKSGENADDELESIMLPMGLGGTGDRTLNGNAIDRNVRMLLTLSNLNHLRREIIPQLIQQFETSFSVKLTEESKTIRDVLAQIDARLFQSYVKPTVDTLTTTITNGISPASWLPTTPRPSNAKPYVYDVLLGLVLVHTEVSTSATALTNQILSYLLEQISTALLAAFKQRTSYTLPALMQATLDVELIAQTLSNYTTEKASELQSQIYLVLDERTDGDARAKLQNELPEMRATLKKLREGTKGQFGCFKRERRGRSDGRSDGRPGSRQ